MWALLATLKMPACAARAYHFFLREEGAAERVADFIERDGAFELRFKAEGREHVARIRPASERR